jgi:hypothetical protein
MADAKSGAVGPDRLEIGGRPAHASQHRAVACRAGTFEVASVFAGQERVEPLDEVNDEPWTADRRTVAKFTSHKLAWRLGQCSCQLVSEDAAG